MPRMLVPGDRFEAFGNKFVVLDINNAKGDILCIRVNNWKRAPFDDKTERDCTNNYVDASIRRLLSYVFFCSMIEVDGDHDYFVRMPVDIVDNFGCREYTMIRDYVRLLTQKEMVTYRKYLDIRDWAWTMSPFRCVVPKHPRKSGDQSVAIADSHGRWGHKRSCYTADIYPVVTFKQKITFHKSFELIK